MKGFLQENIISGVYFIILYALMVWMLFLGKVYLLSLPKWMILLFLIFVSFGVTGFYFGTERFVKKIFEKNHNS